MPTPCVTPLSALGESETSNRRTAACCPVRLPVVHGYHRGRVREQGQGLRCLGTVQRFGPQRSTFELERPVSGRVRAVRAHRSPLEGRSARTSTGAAGLPRKRQLSGLAARPTGRPYITLLDVSVRSPVPDQVRGGGAGTSTSNGPGVGLNLRAVPRRLCSAFTFDSTRAAQPRPTGDQAIGSV